MDTGSSPSNQCNDCQLGQIQNQLKLEAHQADTDIQDSVIKQLIKTKTGYNIDLDKNILFSPKINPASKLGFRFRILNILKEFKLWVLLINNRLMNYKTKIV